MKKTGYSKPVALTDTELSDLITSIRKRKSEKDITSELLNTGQWGSARCDLKWKAARSRYGRSYLKLSVSVPRNTDNSIRLLPTPTTGSNRNSRGAVLRIGRTHQDHGVALGLAQVIEISQGVLPKEFDNWAQVPQFYKRLWPTPVARDHKGARHPETLKRAGRKPTNSLGDTINSITGGNSKINPMFVSEMMGFPHDWLLGPFQYQENLNP